MLGTVRRCSTSLNLTLRPLSTAARCVSSPARPHCFQPSKVANRSLLNIRRYIQNNAPRNQQGHATAAFDAEIEADVVQQRPPSDRDIDLGVAMGPLTKFQQLADGNMIDRKIVQTITRKMRFETMTQVQSLTINEALKGVDVMAQARTGTGKTVAFVLPILQNIITKDPSLASRGGRTARYQQRTKDIRALIISPTRELAEQIAEETKKLVQDTGVVVQCAVGGTQKNMHLRQMQREGCHILVGTPGRLKDILSDPASGVEAPKLSCLTLDEADRLMDQGFWPEIQDIQSILPDVRDQDRQTMMFSATIPREVQQLARTVLKPDMHFVQTVQEDELPTHEKVSQAVVTVSGLENQFPALLELCQREIEMRKADRTKKPFKAIVYFPSTAETQMAAEVFKIIRQNQPSANELTSRASEQQINFLPSTRVFEIHSRLTQQQRTKAAEMFRFSESAILMSSDVTARGMDFPNVTHVIQLGLPQNSDAYIHRIGRTARAGAEGEGWLIIPQMTAREAESRLGHLPLQKDTTLESANVNFMRGRAEAEQSMTPRTVAIFDALRTAYRRLSPDEFSKTYLAYLGTHQWIRDKKRLMESLESMAKNLWGMTQPPEVPMGLAQKLGLSRIPGVNIGSGRFDGGSPFGGRGRDDDRGRFSGRRDSSRFDQYDRFSQGGRRDDRSRGGRGDDMFQGGRRDDSGRGGRRDAFDFAFGDRSRR